MNRQIEVREEHLTTADLAETAKHGALAPAGGAAQAKEPQPLLPQDFVQDLRTRWDRIQTEFVDTPRESVEEADGLVASAIKRLAETFANERQSLESQWDRGDNVSTEDLRVALQRYRSFFQRLLSV
jgi:hypothetical protein